jgi:hypothetical protein
VIHKTILQNFKTCTSHGPSKSQLMDCKFGFHFLMNFDIVHWLMLCVLESWNYLNIISRKLIREGNFHDNNSRVIFMYF